MQRIGTDRKVKRERAHVRLLPDPPIKRCQWFAPQRQGQIRWLASKHGRKQCCFENFPKNDFAKVLWGRKRTQHVCQASRIQTVCFCKKQTTKKVSCCRPHEGHSYGESQSKVIECRKKKRQHLESHRKREGIRSQIRRRGESVLKLESGKKCGGTRKEAGQRKIFNSRVQALTAQGYRPKRTTSSREGKFFFFSILIHSLSSRPPPQATT